MGAIDPPIGAVTTRVKAVGAEARWLLLYSYPALASYLRMIASDGDLNCLLIWR